MTNLLPPVIEPEELLAALASEQILIIAVVSEKVFLEGHLQGSILIKPSELVSGTKPAIGKLPSKEHLDALFSRIGLGTEKHIVAYDDEGSGWAGRLLWTLDVVGHKSYSLLNGGQISWNRSGFTLTTEITENVPSSFDAIIDRSYIADMEEVLASIEDDGIIVWDARAKEEYEGSKITAGKNGHIPGAVNFDWIDLMDRGNNLRLRPIELLKEELEELGITPNKKIITHCQTHHRSGLAYFVGKLLGLNIKAYDGSWSEWGNHPDTPVEQ
jgi:thiosulfate/3-mercaptopyruvate sulfurtransferase